MLVGVVVRRRVMWYDFVSVGKGYVDTVGEVAEVRVGWGRG